MHDDLHTSTPPKKNLVTKRHTVKTPNPHLTTKTIPRLQEQLFTGRTFVPFMTSSKMLDNGFHKKMLHGWL